MRNNKSSLSGLKLIYNSNLCVPSSSSGLLFQRMGTHHKKKITENFNHYFWNFCVGGISDRVKYVAGGAIRRRS